MTHSLIRLPRLIKPGALISSDGYEIKSNDVIHHLDIDESDPKNIVIKSSVYDRCYILNDKVFVYYTTFDDDGNNILDDLLYAYPLIFKHTRNMLKFGSKWEPRWATEDPYILGPWAEKEFKIV